MNEWMHTNDLISRQDAINAIDKRIVQLLKNPVFRRKYAHIDLYGAKQMIREIPSVYMGCHGCVHYDQQQTALICRDCKRSYRDMYEDDE